MNLLYYCVYIYIRRMYMLILVNLKRFIVFFLSLPSRSFLPLVFSSRAFSPSCFCSKGFFLEFISFFLPITIMDNTVVEGLSNLRLTKEEEEEISIKSRCKSDLLEECSLSLFGRLLADRNQNLRVLKNTLRLAWKMGSNLQIVDVGKGILQFKFSSAYQMKWVEKNGPWNFKNNLLLMCRWRRGLSAMNISFTHSPFWVQIWGLPFELMFDEVGGELGNNIGRFIEVDRCAQSDQAKFMRIRVDLQLDKPLRRGGKLLVWKVKNFGLISSMKGSPYFVFIVGDWVMMRNTIKSFQISKIPGNTVNGSELRETKKWVWKNLDQSVMGIEVRVVQIGLRIILSLQRRFPLLQCPIVTTALQVAWEIRELQVQKILNSDVHEIYTIKYSHIYVFSLTFMLFCA